MEKKVTCASFFSGIGGIDIGFEEQGFEVVFANEIDSYACQLYNQNFTVKAKCQDIRDININEIPTFDVLLAGFPCQPFSIAGNQKGFSDKEKGNLFFELERIYKEKKPKVIFLENVKNLMNHDFGKTLQVMVLSLREAGYKVKYQVCNSCEYTDIPQSRERIYIVAFLEEDAYDKFKFPDKDVSTGEIKHFLETTKIDDCFFYTKKVKFYNKLKEGIVKENTIYQWRRSYVRENTKGLCPTLTANMGTGGNNVPIILTKEGIRKLTPRECLNLQGFPAYYNIKGLANSRLYKHIGNSVVVPMVSRIAKEIMTSI